jgi:hypothetical protein
MKQFHKIKLLIVFNLMLLAGLSSYCSGGSAATVTRRSNQGIDKIAEHFVTLSKLGGVIQRPKLPEEFYHNAKMYELNGDITNARISYEAYFKYNLPFIDPYIDYVKLLKITENESDISAIVTKYKNTTNDVLIRTVLMDLVEDNKKIELFNSIESEYPEFGPAYYYIYSIFSSRFIDSREKDLLTSFVNYCRKGNCYKYFIDKRIVLGYIESANKRLAGLKHVSIDKLKYVCESKYEFISGKPILRAECRSDEVIRESRLVVDEQAKKNPFG